MSEQMDYERAVEIVGACVQNGVYHMLGDNGRPVPSIASYSLAEMVEANRIVREVDLATQEPGSGPRTIHMTCDDRLTAALYVAAHFPGSDPADPDIICLLPDGRGVFVLDAREALVPESAVPSSTPRSDT